MCGVRPAAHISLESLASYAGYDITASLASGATDRAQISQDSAFYKLNSGAEFNLTFAAYTGYYISAVSLNAVEIEISASVASAATFLDFNGGICKYKCYRNGNSVLLILKDVTQDLNIVGTDIVSPITVTLTGASASSATYSAEYDAATGNATVSVSPASGTWVTGVSLTGGSVYQDIDKWQDLVYQTSECLAVSYLNNNYSNRIKFYVTEITGQIALTLRLENQQIPLSQGGGTSISGVALQTSLSGGANTLACVGKATITGYSTTDGLEEVIVCAAASAGFAFSHWEVDGEKLTQSDGTAYGISAMIPYELVENKILVAVFTANNANINTETDNTGVLT